MKTRKLKTKRIPVIDISKDSLLLEQLNQVVKFDEKPAKPPFSMINLF